jgi:hypothetical protein
MKTLRIENPCFEKSEKMSPENGGLFCSSCQHLVTDFTDWKTEEIVSYLKFKGEEQTCGIMHQEQMKPVRNKTIFHYLRVATLVIGGVFFARNDVKAQVNTKLVPAGGDSNAVKSDSIVWVIKGNVELKGRNVKRAHGSKITAFNSKGEVVATAYSGADGSFELHLSAASKQEEFTLQFSARGFRTKRIENYIPANKKVLGVTLHSRWKKTRAYAVRGCVSF